MKTFKTTIGVTLELTPWEIRTMERLTGELDFAAVDGFVQIMAEEFIWPNEETVRAYLRSIGGQHEE